MEVTLDNNAYIALDHLGEQERQTVQAAIDQLRRDTNLSSPKLKRLDRASNELYDVYVYRVDPVYRMFFRRQRLTPTRLEVTDVIRAEAIDALAPRQAAH